MICAKCGATNLRSARACSNCGASLTGEEAPRTPEAPQASPPEAEYVLHRKTVEGRLEAEHPLEQAATVIGRSEGDLTCPGDPKLSRRHARVRQEAGGLWLEDLKSTNGTYLRLRSPYQLSQGDVIVAGNELLRFDQKAGPTPSDANETDKTLFFGEAVPTGEFVLVDATGKELRRFPLEKLPAVIGRGPVELSFPEDKGMAQRHARVRQESDGFYLEDLGSARGVFVRIGGKVELVDGDQFLTGEQVFEVHRRQSPA